MSNSYTDVSAVLEFELPGQEEAVLTHVDAEVCRSRWSDLPAEDWCESMELTWEDGTPVPQDAVDLHGRNLWQVAEVRVLEQAA